VQGSGVNEPGVSLSNISPHLEYMSSGSAAGKVVPGSANAVLLIGEDLRDCMLIAITLMPRC
jgi:hypothetical protein